MAGSCNSSITIVSSLPTYAAGDCVKDNATGAIYGIAGIVSGNYAYSRWLCLGWSSITSPYLPEFISVTDPSLANTVKVACPTPIFAVGDCVTWSGATRKVTSIAPSGNTGYVFYYSNWNGSSWVAGGSGGVNCSIPKVTCPH